jgi:uncharacterized protein involved in high-affinity Fe2+ transport
MQKSKKSLSLFLVVVLGMLGFTACSEKPAAAPVTSGAPAAPAAAVAPGETAGFEEFDIGDEIEVGPLNVAGVYFQPVDMDPASGSLPKSEADMHIEADISALENNGLGYGAGDFVPYLTVKYEILKEDGSKHLEGAFMPMNASDGPHYGANIKLGDAGKYKVRFIIDNPSSFGYLLHVDKATGVEGRFWAEPLVAEWDFNYVPREW